MGVLGLWDVLESVGHPIKVEGLEGKILGVDANIWLYKFIRGFREKDNGSASIDSHKLGLFNRISKLLYYKIKPVFVFDGPAPILKRRTLERRQNFRNKHLTQVQDAALKALANQLKTQYPNADINQLRITLPQLRSNNLVAAEKLTDEDFNLFYLPPKTDEDNETRSGDGVSDAEFDSDEDSDCGVVFDSNAQYSSKVDINSKDFEQLPAEMRYEILHDIKDTRKRIRNVEVLPEDAGSFSNFQLERLRARRKVQEKIEKCEKDICTNYTGELADGSSIQAMRVQSDARSTILYRNNTYDPKALEKLNEETKPVTRDEIVKPEIVEPKPSVIPEHLLRIEEDDEEENGYGDDEDEEDLPRKHEKTINLASQQSIHPTLFPRPSESHPNELSPSPLSETHSEDETSPPLSESQSPKEIQSLIAESSIDKAPSPTTSHSRTDKTTPSPLPTTRSSSSSSESLQTIPNSPENEPNSNLVTVLSSSSESIVTLQELPPAPLNKTILVSSTESISSIVDDPPAKKSLITSSQPEMTAPMSPSTSIANKSSSQPVSSLVQSTNRKDSEQTSSMKPKEKSNYEPISSSSQPQTNAYSDQVINAQRTNKVTSKIIDEAKELLRLFGIPYIDAAGEAEAQCALLEELKLTEGTITDDSDIWLFGAQHVYRYFFSDDKYVMQYKMNDIEYHIRMTRENLVCFAMLVGSDYTDGIMNVGPVTALEVLSEFPGEGIEPLTQFAEWHQSVMRDKTLLGDKKRKKLLKYRLPEEFPSRAVYDGYMRPAADASTEQFSWATPELDELREYARRNFGWPQKKVDEKLLPVLKRLNEKKLQPTIDTFFFKTQANRNPEMFRSKRVNQALNKIAKRAALAEKAPVKDDVVNLTDEDEFSDDDDDDGKAVKS